IQNAWAADAECGGAVTGAQGEIRGAVYVRREIHAWLLNRNGLMAFVTGACAVTGSRLSHLCMDQRDLGRLKHKMKHSMKDIALVAGATVLLALCAVIARSAKADESSEWQCGKVRVTWSLNFETNVSESSTRVRTEYLVTGIERRDNRFVWTEDG